MEPNETETVEKPSIDELVRELDELLDACFLGDIAPAMERAHREILGEAA